MVTMMVEIPTVTIDLKTGNKLKQLSRSQGEIILKFEMPIPQSDQIDLDVYIDLSDSQIYSFLKNIKNHILQFEGKINIIFHLYKPNTNNNNEQKNQAQLEVMMNCLDFDSVFDFMDLYYTTCIEQSNFQPNCLQKLVQSLDFKAIQDFQVCLDSHKYKLGNVIKNMKPLKNGRSSYLMINGNTYHGSIKPENVFEAICGAFSTSPNACLFLNNKYSVLMHYTEYKRKYNNYKFMVYFINFVILVLLLTLAGGAIYLVYNKIYERYLNENLSKIVKNSMSNYQSIKNNI